MRAGDGVRSAVQHLRRSSVATSTTTAASVERRPHSVLLGGCLRAHSVRVAVHRHLSRVSQSVSDSTRCHLIPLLGPLAIAVGVVVAPPAAAECNASGAATVCAQGEVRGGSGPAAGSTYDPYQCSDPYLCYYDEYDPLIVTILTGASIDPLAAVARAADPSSVPTVSSSDESMLS